MAGKLNHRSMHMSVKHLVTAEELWNIPNPLDKRRELVNGEVVEASPTTMLHGVIVGQVYEAIRAFVRQQDLGIVAAGDVGYVLRRDPDHVRAPDVSFVAWEDVPESGLPERGFWNGPPALAAEVVSPDDRASEIHAKVRDFLEAGTRQVWVLWPQQRSVTVHEPDGAAQ
jgi:Uma2 family endonuclease